MSPIPLGILAAAGVGGAAGDFDLLETEILTADTASVTFTGLSSYTDYKHLQIRMAVRTNRNSTGDALSLRLNGISGSSYAWHYLFGSGSAVGSGGNSGQSFILGGVTASANTGTNAFGSVVTDILDPFSTTKNTTLRDLSGYLEASTGQVRFSSGFLNNTAAITSISIEANAGTALITGSRFSLYGLKETV